MKTLLFGDPHITTHNEFSNPTQDGLTSYLQECAQTFQWLAGVISQEHPDMVVCLGDVFDQTGGVDTRSQVVGVRGMSLIANAAEQAKKNVALHALVGNHDLYDGHNALHNLEWLNRDWYVHTKLSECWNQPGVLLIPWTQDEASIRAALAERKPVTIISHIEIEGSVRYAQGGNLEDRGVSPKVFNGCYVFNGHYHSPNYVTPPPLSEDTYYVCNVGSPHSRIFSDAGSAPRGAMIVELDEKTGRVTSYHSIPNPHAYRYVDVTVTPEVEIRDPEVHRWNARIFYTPDQEVRAQELASRCHAYRLTPIGGAEIVLREETLTAQKTPLANLQEYLELQLPGLKDPTQYLDLDHYSQDLVAKVPPSHYPQAVEFESLTIHNFCSIGDVTYNYKPGVVLVEGRNADDPTAASNGSGKTVLVVDAFYWALTGEVIRKGVAVDEVVKEGETSGYVTLKFKAGNLPYTLTRTRENAGRGAGSRLTLLQGDTPVDLRKKGDSEAKLLEVLRFDPDRLLQVVLLTADRQSRFSQLGPTDRIKVVEEMAGAQVYDDLRDLTGKDVTALEAAFRRLEGTVSTLRTQVLQSTSNIGRLQEHLALAEARRADLLEGLRAEEEEIRGKLVQVQKDHQEANTKVTEAMRRLETVEGEAKTARQKIDATRAQLTTVESDLSKCRMKKAREEATLAAKQKDHDTLSAAPANICPTCNQPTKTDYRLVKLAALQADIKNLQGLVEEGAGVIARVEGDVQRVRTALVEMEGCAQTVLTTQGQYRAELAAARTQVTAVERIAQELKARLQTNLQNTKHTETETDQLKKAIADATAERDQLVAKEAEVTVQVAAAEKSWDTARWWFAALAPSGLRSFIVEQSLQFLNQRLAQYSPRVLGPKLGVVILTSFKETKAGGISNRIDIKLSGGRSFAKLSSGQRRRVDLAIQFALHDLAESTSAGTNVLICDEILDPIDGLGCRGIVDILTEMVKTAVFLTTHNPELKGLQYRERWMVSLQNGTSKVEVWAS